MLNMLISYWYLIKICLFAMRHCNHQNCSCPEKEIEKNIGELYLQFTNENWLLEKFFHRTDLPSECFVNTSHSQGWSVLTWNKLPSDSFIFLKLSSWTKSLSLSSSLSPHSLPLGTPCQRQWRGRGRRRGRWWRGEGCSQVSENVWYQMHDIKCMISNAWYQMYDIKCIISNLNHQK